MSQVFYKKAIQYCRKATFLWETSFCFSDRNFQLSKYWTNAFFHATLGIPKLFQIHYESRKHLKHARVFEKNKTTILHLQKVITVLIGPCTYKKRIQLTNNNLTWHHGLWRCVRKLYSASSWSSTDGLTCFSTQLYSVSCFHCIWRTTIIYDLSDLPSMPGLTSLNNLRLYWQQFFNR